MASQNTLHRRWQRRRAKVRQVAARRANRVGIPLQVVNELFKSSVLDHVDLVFTASPGLMAVLRKR